MTFYAQFGEDVAISSIFKGRKEGFYVDIGAHDGVTDSNTLYFAKNHGFKGICVEPHSDYYPRLKANRPEAKCLNIVAWGKSYEAVNFHETAPGGWSRVGGGGEHPTIRVTHPVTRTLDDILCESAVCFMDVDLMSIDVEGTEQHVLDGFTLEDYLPRIVIIEDLSHRGQHDDYFKGYRGVYGWAQGKGGSNAIYCLYEDDYKIVKARYR